MGRRRYWVSSSECALESLSVYQVRLRLDLIPMRADAMSVSGKIGSFTGAVSKVTGAGTGCFTPRRQTTGAVRTSARARLHRPPCPCGQPCLSPAQVQCCDT